MKIQGAGLLLWLVCGLQAHALEYANAKLGFKATLPDGYEDVSALVMKRNSLAMLGKFSADGKSMERLVVLQDLGAPIGREMPPASVVPKNTRVEKVPWKSYDVLLFVVTEVEATGTTLTLNAQVPLKPRAIQVSVYGPLSDEARLRQELRTILASVEGPTNWSERELAAAAAHERAVRFGQGTGKLAGWLLVIAILMVIKRRFYSKSDSEVGYGAQMSADRSEEGTCEVTNPMGRLLVCACVLFAGLVWLIMRNSNGNVTPERIGDVVSMLFFPLLITGIWAGKSSKNWGWFRCGFTLTMMLVLVVVIRVAPKVGQAGARAKSPQPAAESQAR